MALTYCVVYLMCITLIKARSAEKGKRKKETEKDIPSQSFSLKTESYHISGLAPGIKNGVVILGMYLRKNVLTSGMLRPKASDRFVCTSSPVI